IFCVVERRRDVDQVPQFLRVDAHLVKSRRRGVLIDGLGASGNSSAQPPGTRTDHFCEETSRIAGVWIGRNRSFEKRLPSGKKTPIAIAVQRSDKSAVLLVLRPAQESHQRLHVGERKRSPALPEGEDEHIHVAWRAGETTDPRELRRKVLYHVEWEHVSDLAEQ